VQHLISKTLADMKISVDYTILVNRQTRIFYGHDGWAEFSIAWIHQPELLHDAAKLFSELSRFQSTQRAAGFCRVDERTAAGIRQIKKMHRSVLGEDSFQAKIRHTGENLKEFALQDLKKKRSICGYKNTGRSPELRMEKMFK